jgi:hypothetical protein
MIDERLLKDMVGRLLSTLSPTAYLEGLGFTSYPWQRDVLDVHRRLILKCPRQSGKSTIVAAKAGHRCKHYPNSLVLLYAPTENQAIELMEKISVFLSQDPEVKLERNSTVEKRFKNGSRIRAFTANPVSARGYSAPDMIIFDEAAYTDDELYLTVRPMITPTTELILLSTPNGKRGFFYETWEYGEHWTKIQVDVADIRGAREPFEERRQKALEEGIQLYLSPRQTEEVLREELRVMGERWYRQEYEGEFLDMTGAVFDMDSLYRALDTTEKAIDLEGGVEFTDEVEALWA